MRLAVLATESSRRTSHPLHSPVLLRLLHLSGLTTSSSPSTIKEPGGSQRGRAATRQLEPRVGGFRVQTRERGTAHCSEFLPMATSPPSSIRALSTSTGSSEEEPPPARQSWFERLKGAVIGRTKPTIAPTLPAGESARPDVLTLDQFAEQLQKARRFGSLTEFGRGLPRGGQRLAAASLERQEQIIHSMTPEERADLSLFGPAQRQRVADACRCHVSDVDNTISKFRWFEEAARRVHANVKAGKPAPTSMEEVEKLMGGRWSPDASRSLARPGEQVSRNAACPCGSGKKYKRCCAPKQQGEAFA